MSEWLRRITRRWHEASEPGGCRSEISELFYKRSLFKTSGAFLSELIALFRPGDEHSEADLRVLVAELRGHWGAEKALADGEIDEQLTFWGELGRRSESPYAVACYADLLLVSGRVQEALDAFLEAFAGDPSLCVEMGDELASSAKELGEPYVLRFRLAQLRAALDSPSEQDGDDLHERYAEMLEDYSSNSPALQQIRELGSSLREAVAQGALPRAMVRRGRSRHDS